ncbi:MAG TPA: trigger factor [Negativicutes bacterium]|nr:trigger factor [Negativicutes bacterium]
MKVTVEKKEHNITEMVIELPVEDVAKAFDKAYQKLAQQVNIPGFRKGKAPRKMVETRVGADGMRSEAFDFIIPDAYRRAVEENSIDPVGRPEVTEVTLNAGEPCVFTVNVITRPEVVLGEYKGLTADAPVTEVTTEEVDKQIESLRERHAKMVVAEDAALGQGDFALIDFDGTVDGKPFSGGQSKGYPLEIGSGSFIPGFEDQLIGAKSGEEREVKVTFPAEYFVPELAGKEAVFITKINDVKRKELPELNDDFAKEAGDADTLTEMKEKTLAKLTEAAKNKDEEAFREAALKQAVANATIEVPEVMVDEQVEHMIQDMDMSLTQRGLSLDKYLGYMNTDIAGLRERYRPAALEEVRTELTLEAIVKAEALAVMDEEYSEEVEKMAKAYKMSDADLKKMLADKRHVEAVKETILRRKAAKFVVDSAVKA